MPLDDRKSGYSNSQGIPSRRSAILSAAIFGACILASYPVSNIPWGDDFSYTKSALEFAHTGRLLYNGWATAMVGWQILWGALFIKLFGFSFTVVQLSMIPVSIASIYLLHLVLQRFGMSPREALVGSLTLGLTPLFLELSTNFMTDIPGLFAILLCVWMCQNAAAAEDGRTARKWIVLAAVVNVAAGSVRQTSWLGALVMVPSTAWMLRRWRGMLPTAAIMWFLSLCGILSCIHWFNRQPYSVPEPFSLPLTLHSLKHLTIYSARTIFCLLLLLFPITVAWLPTARRLDRRARTIAGTCVTLLIVMALILAHRRTLGSWTMPWLVPFLDQDVRLTPLWLRWAFSGTVVLTGVITISQLASSVRGAIRPGGQWSAQTSAIFWILGPFTLAYIGVLLPRAGTALIQDRYLLVLEPSVIAFLLLAHRRWVAPDIPAISVAVLVVYALSSVGWNHDNFAHARAMKTTIDQMLANGVPETSIQAGLGVDGWTQTQHHGFINEQRIRNPADAYDPTLPNWGLIDECNYWISTYTPVIRPEYFISEFPRACPGSTVRSGAGYRAWIPPFDRVIKVQALPLHDR